MKDHPYFCDILTNKPHEKGTQLTYKMLQTLENHKVK